MAVTACRKLVPPEIEGTLREHKPDHARPRAGHSLPSDPFSLRDFRGREDPRVPVLPSPEPEW